MVWTKQRAKVIVQSSISQNSIITIMQNYWIHFSERTVPVAAVMRAHENLLQQIETVTGVFCGIPSWRLCGIHKVCVVVQINCTIISERHAIRGSYQNKSMESICEILFFEPNKIPWNNLYFITSNFSFEYMVMYNKNR